MDIQPPVQIKQQAQTDSNQLKLQEISYFFPQDEDIQWCGCYLMDPSALGLQYEQALVPLRHIDYHLEIVNSLLHITLTQKYFNPSDKYLQVNYSMPITPQSSIYKFQTEFNNVFIEGIVKQREEAKKEYEKAKNQGKQAVIASVDKASKDVFNITIGNIPPQTQFKVTIFLLQQMKITMSTFYEVYVPSTISPRYLNKVGSERKVPEYMQQKGEMSGQPDYTWSFKINLKTTKKIIFHQSKTHKLKLLNSNKEENELLFVMENEEFPNKDFSFLFTTENFHLPSYVLGKTDTTSTVMVSFIPKFCDLNVDDAYKSQLENKQFEVEIGSTKGDYVFFLDRSGSMGGVRIQKAKQALIMFLKSLPQDSYFNVISFGDSSKRMFDQSVKYSTDKFKKAKKQIQSMSADMGGTQIYESLEQLLNEQPHPGFLRNIYILTDGGVSNTQGVIKMIKQNTKYSRVHCIGVGNGVSLNLVQGGSKAGKGKFVLIQDSQNPSNKIIEILQTSLTPLITKLNFAIHNPELIESIIPNPKSIPYILKDQIVNFYVTYKQIQSPKLAFTFQYEDSISKLPYKSQIQINILKSQSFPFVDKMAHLKVLRTLESFTQQTHGNLEDYMDYVKVVDYKKQAIQYSIKHQVLSKYTAFLCVGKQLVDGQYQQYKDAQKISIDVLQHLPRQYLFKIKYPNGMQAKPQPYYEEVEDVECDMGLFGDEDIGSYGSGCQYRGDMQQESCKVSEQCCFNQAMDMDVQINRQMTVDKPCKKSKEEEPKGGFFNAISTKITNLLNKQEQKEKQEVKVNTHKGKYTKIKQIVDLQQIDGHWKQQSLIETLAKVPNQMKKLTSLLGEDVLITQLVILWIEKYHTDKQYSLIIKKAKSWLKKKLQEKGLDQKLLKNIQCF